MLRTISLAGLVALSWGFLCGQPLAEFEVATVKLAPPQPPGRVSSRMTSDTQKGRLNYTNVSLTDVLAQAYKVQRYQIDGPDWLKTERFDIVARFPAGAAREQI